MEISIPDNLSPIDCGVDSQPRNSRQNLRQDVCMGDGDAFTVKGAEVRVKEVPESPSAGTRCHV